MSFWDLEGGDSAAVGATKEYDVGGGDLVPIPNNSDVLAVVDQAKWQHKDRDDNTSPRFIELRWSIMAPDEYKNRKVYHKVWVTDFDPEVFKKKGEQKAKEKRDKARRMLATIDMNAGGNLLKTGDAPTDDSLTLHLCNKPMVIKAMVWSMKGSDGTDMAGNWISAVKTADSPLHISDEKPPKASGGSSQTPSGGAGSRDMDDEIPF